MAIIDSLSFVPGINLNDISFTDEEIANSEALIAESISARHPSLDVSPTTSLYDLQARPGAIEYLNNRAMSLAIQATQSLKGVQENPELASNDVVDAILSNYSVTRRSGVVATGSVKIDVSQDVAYSILATEGFTSASGAKFYPDADYLVTSGQSEGDLQLRPADSENDQFYFILPLIASEVGVDSQLADNVELIPDVPILNFISAYSFGAFTGAINEETNDELIARIPEAISAKNRVSKASLSSELKNAFPSVIDVSVQGYGDAALLRGSGTILPIKSGGFADVWVRTSLAAVSVATDVIATLNSVSGTGRGTCSCTVAETDHPGHFFVASVRASERAELLGTYGVTSQTKSITTSGHKNASVSQGAFGKYQSTDVVFVIDPEAGQAFPAVGEEFSVSVETIGIPQIDKIQDFIDDPDTRAAGVDYLVRASVPCLVWLSPITVNAEDGTDEDAIRTAIFSYINNIPMGESLFIDGIVMAIRSVGGVNNVILPIRVNGRVFCPDGSSINLTSESALTAPSRPDIQVVPRTVAFYVSIDDIPISVILS